MESSSPPPGPTPSLGPKFASSAAATRNPRTVMFAGLGILALVMVAVIGVITSLSHGPKSTVAQTGNDPGTTPGLAGDRPSLTGYSAGNTQPALPPMSGSSLTTGPTPTPSPLEGAPISMDGNSTPSPMGLPLPTTGGGTPTSHGGVVGMGHGPGMFDDPTRPATTDTTFTPDAKTYTVVSGDTLWKIAQKSLGNGTKWKQIQAANPGLDGSRIRVGMKIKIPAGGSASSTPSTSTPTATHTPSTRSRTTSPATTASRTVTVKSGDTLYAIAKRVYGDGEKWDTIYDANKSKLKNPHALAAGMTLNIPPRHTNGM